MAVSVLIVDDHAPFRSFARTLLSAEGFEVVGEATDGASAVDAVVRLRPDVVLLDVQLPDANGFTVAERIAEVPDPPQVVLISTRDASAYRRRLEAARVRGFIAKDELSGPVLAALVG
jgi:two-component system, NarL family, nitrate/nitrite response regulator NarL